MGKQPIGAFTLHELGRNRTMLTVLPRSRWGNGGLTQRELAILAYSGNEYDEYFVQFIERLKERLTHYSLIVTWARKLRRRLYTIAKLLLKLK